MKVASFLSLAAALLLASSAVAADAPKRAVDVRANGDDALTGKLVEAVRAALPGAERVRVETPEEDDDLALVVAGAKVDDKRFTWSADLLKLHAGFTPDRLGAFAGKCRQDDVKGCAAAILADADRAVRKAEKE